MELEVGGGGLDPYNRSIETGSKNLLSQYFYNLDLETTESPHPTLGEKHSKCYNRGVTALSGVDILGENVHMSCGGETRAGHVAQIPKEMQVPFLFLQR